MRKIKIPKTDLQASMIVLGTDYFGSGPKTLPDLRESISNAGATLSQAALSYLEHGKSFNE
jgi:hypothetical protein